MEEGFDLDLDIDLEDLDESEPENRHNLFYNCLLIALLVVELIAFVFTWWLIAQDKGGPAIGLFLFMVMIMCATMFIGLAKWWLKWVIIN